MKIELNNICKISHCEITLDGITVIAGENGTGKSTVGKALYSVFNSFSNRKSVIKKTKRDSLYTVFSRFNDNSTPLQDSFLYGDIIDELLSDSEEYINNKNELKKKITKFIIESEDFIIPKENINAMVDTLLSVLKITDTMIVNKILQNRIDAEFNRQVSNLYNNSDNNIIITVKDNIVNVNINSNAVISHSGLMDLYSNAIYIDDPYILYPQRNFSVGRTYYDHQNEMRKKLFFNNNQNNVIDDILTNEKLNNIYSKIENICKGDLSFTFNRAYYVLPNSKKLGIQNIATGLTTFVIIKSLLQRGIIKEKGLIILDEPETHLHPKWQLLFAEIIVLLQKEFDLTILLNTHSPYFLEAIEVYSEKYGIKDKCKYYLSEDNEANNSFVINDVTDNTELIYKKLASPFQTLEDERYSSDD